MEAGGADVSEHQPARSWDLLTALLDYLHLPHRLYNAQKRVPKLRAKVARMPTFAVQSKRQKSNEREGRNCREDWLLFENLTRWRLFWSWSVKLFSWLWAGWIRLSLVRFFKAYKTRRVRRVTLCPMLLLSVTSVSSSIGRCKWLSKMEFTMSKREWEKSLNLSTGTYILICNL